MNQIREKLILKLKLKVDFIKKNIVQFRMLEFNIGSNSHVEIFIEDQENILRSQFAAERVIKSSKIIWIAGHFFVQVTSVYLYF